MRIVDLTYWITTVLFSAMMAASGLAYLLSSDFQNKFARLGFPSYFRIELAVFKLAGVLALLLPIPQPFKEWAYGGFFIVLVSALVAHLAHRDGLKKAMAPVSVAVLLIASYLSYRMLVHT